MRRFVHGLLAALILVGTMSAKTYTNKTFLMPRSHNPNLAMESTTWHTQTALIDEAKFGGTAQATLFYDKSNNKCDLAKYFGVCNWGNSNKTEDFLTVVPSWAYAGATLEAGQPKHIPAPFMFHAATVTGAPGLKLADKIYWRPYRESYGVRLDYHQKLDKVLKGLFFKVSMPIVHVKTSMGYTSSCVKDLGSCCDDPCGTSCKTECATPCAKACDPCETKCCDGFCVKQNLFATGDAPNTPSGTEKSVVNYLTGNVTNDAVGGAQVALCKAKIHCGQSETGIADIDIMLGYNFLYKPTRHVAASIGLTIPTGNTPDAEYLWEPVVGNGSHWAFGVGLDSKFELWKDDDKSLDFVLAFNYRYLFSSNECRTLGFNWHDSPIVGNGTPTDIGRPALYGHWWLGGKKGETTSTPMANYLTKKLKVTPGSQFDGIAALAFNYANWTFDFGYNLFYKEKEDIDFKCGTDCSDSCASTCSPCGTSCTVTSGWDDDTIGIPESDWDQSAALVAGDLAAGNSIWINRKDICTSPAVTDSVTTHKLYGGFGYVFKEWEYPLLLGLGGSYEWVSDNNALEVWSLWGKIGLTF